MMKKMVAVLMACAMMMGLSMVASADLYGELYPGEEYVIKASVQVDGTYTNDDGEVKDYRKSSITRSNFKITDIDWEEGGGLVEYVRITDDGLVLKLKPRDSAVARDLVGTVTIESRVDTERTGLSKGDEFEFEIDAIVTYDEEEINRGDEVKNDQSNEYYHASEGGWVDFTSTYADVRAYVVRGEDYYVYCSNDPIEEIENLYPDAKDHALYVSFPGRPTFTESATIRIKVDEEGYLYQYVNGQLKELDAVWFPNGNSGLEFRTSTLGTYVWSDVELVASSSGSSTTGTSASNTAATTTGTTTTAPATSQNPDTGSAVRAVALAGSQVLGRF